MPSFPPLKQRIAIIDLGSNTARLMVAQYTPGQVFKITDEVSRRVRLSEGMSSDNNLHSSAILRAFDTLQMFKSFCEGLDIHHILPVTTAAVRDADNGPSFLKEVRRQTGLNFRLLSGDEEAFYGAVGVINGLGVTNGIVLDVGGGSAEIALIQSGTYQKGFTTPLGAIRTQEVYFPDEGTTLDQVKPFNQMLKDTFEKKDWMILGKGMTMNGIGGSVRALARIDRTMRRYPLGLVHGYELKLRRLENLIDRLASLPVSDRVKAIPGLQADREDIILPGALVVAGVMRKAGANKMIVSGQGLREGLFYETFVQGDEAYRIESLRHFSILNLVRLYGFEGSHTSHVAHLSLSLFDQLEPIHGFGAAEREHLWAGAMLHDIGTIIDYYDHHKHSAYIILNAGLPGFTHREVIIIAYLCLNHRSGKPDFSSYHALLRKRDLDMVYRLSSLLRLAEYLDRSRTQNVANLHISTGGKKATLTLMPNQEHEAAVEMWEAKQNAKLFEKSFGMDLKIEMA